MDIEKAIDALLEVKSPKFKKGDVVITHGGHRKYEVEEVLPRKPHHEQAYMVKELGGPGRGRVAGSYLKLA